MRRSAAFALNIKQAERFSWIRRADRMPFWTILSHFNHWPGVRWKLLHDMHNTVLCYCQVCIGVYSVMPFDSNSWFYYRQVRCCCVRLYYRLNSLFCCCRCLRKCSCMCYSFSWQLHPWVTRVSYEMHRPNRLWHTVCNILYQVIYLSVSTNAACRCVSALAAAVTYTNNSIKCLLPAALCSFVLSAQCVKAATHVGRSRLTV